MNNNWNNLITNLEELQETAIALLDKYENDEITYDKYVSGLKEYESVYQQYQQEKTKLIDQNVDFYDNSRFIEINRQINMSKIDECDSQSNFLDINNTNNFGDGDNGDTIDFDYDKFLASWKVALEVQEKLTNSYSSLNSISTNIALSSGKSSIGDLSNAKACLNGACGCSGTENINGLLDTYKRLNDTYIKIDEENARKFSDWNKKMYPEQFWDSEDEEDSYN